MSAFVTALFKPLAMAVFFVIVGTIVGVLFRGFPEGRLKTFLFKVRREEGSPETSTERFVIRSIAIVLVLGVWGLMAWLASP